MGETNAWIKWKVHVRPKGTPKKTWNEVIKKIVRPDKYARKMICTVGNGES